MSRKAAEVDHRARAFVLARVRSQNISLRDLARDAGVPRETVRRWLTGGSAPPFGVVWRCMQAMSVEVAWLAREWDS